MLVAYFLIYTESIANVDKKADIVVIYMLLAYKLRKYPMAECFAPMLLACFIVPVSGNLS